MIKNIFSLIMESWLLRNVRFYCSFLLFYVLRNLFNMYKYLFYWQGWQLHDCWRVVTLELLYLPSLGLHMLVSLYSCSLQHHISQLQLQLQNFTWVSQKEKTATTLYRILVVTGYESSKTSVNVKLLSGHNTLKPCVLKLTNGKHKNLKVHRNTTLSFATKTIGDTAKLKIWKRKLGRVWLALFDTLELI